MFCPNCGNNIEDNLMNCPVCGNSMGMQAQQPVQNQYEQPMNQQPVQNQYAQPMNQQPVQNQYNQPMGQPPVQNQYNQPPYQYPYNPYPGMPGFQNNYAIIEDFVDQAKSLRNLGIAAAVLMFGIGFIFSIVIFVKSRKLKAPELFNPTPEEIAKIEDGKKKLKIAKILAILPLVACGLSFIYGFIGGLTGGV